MCRQEVPRDFIEHPKLLEYSIVEKNLTEGYHWYYEGRNGNGKIPILHYFRLLGLEHHFWTL